ncbi:MAG TPA: RNA polymerase sigma factor [Acidimicrobiales bacterium]
MTTADASDPDSDRSLVERARTGDRDALDTLLRRHHDRLAALCRRLTGDPADADDALQEALIAVARGIRRFDGRATFSTWTYRVTTNACFDELRRRRRRPDLVDPDGSGPVGGMPDPAPGVDAVAGRLDVEAALAHLPEEFRAAVVLRDLCDLDYAQIAEVLDLPPGTVRSRIARGRRRLADLLGYPTGVEPPTPGSPAALGNPPTIPDRPTPRP